MKVDRVTEATDEVVEALRRLLPQLSPTAHPPTREELETMIASGSYLFVARKADATIVGALSLGLYVVPTGLKGIVDAIGALVRDGARVVAAGLAQEFSGLPFGAMPTLLCVAEFVDKLEAVCHRCGGPATMTQRLVDGEPAPFGGETIQVGALDSYEARCRACFAPGEDALAAPLASAHGHSAA